MINALDFQGPGMNLFDTWTAERTSNYVVMKQLLDLLSQAINICLCLHHMWGPITIHQGCKIVTFTSHQRYCQSVRFLCNTKTSTFESPKFEQYYYRIWESLTLDVRKDLRIPSHCQRRTTCRTKPLRDTSSVSPKGF